MQRRKLYEYDSSPKLNPVVRSLDELASILIQYAKAKDPMQCLREFTVKYNSLNDRNKESVTDLIIRSLASFRNIDDLMPLLGYYNSYVISMRNFIDEKEWVQHSAAELEKAVLVENFPKRVVDAIAQRFNHSPADQKKAYFNEEAKEIARASNRRIKEEQAREQQIRQPVAPKAPLVKHGSAFFAAKKEGDDTTSISSSPRKAGYLAVPKPQSRNEHVAPQDRPSAPDFSALDPNAQSHQLKRSPRLERKK